MGYDPIEILQSRFQINTNIDDGWMICDPSETSKPLPTHSTSSAVGLLPLERAAALMPDHALSPRRDPAIQDVKSITKYGRFVTRVRHQSPYQPTQQAQLSASINLSELQHRGRIMRCPD